MSKYSFFVASQITSGLFISNEPKREMIISIFNACQHQDRKLKEGTSIERAREILSQLWEEDYLDLTYTLWINGEIDTEYNPI